MSVALFDSNELANVCLWLSNSDIGISAKEAAELLSEWSKGNTRAYNEQYRERQMYVSESAILEALHETTFRFNRETAKGSLSLMSYNVFTNAGKGPEGFEQFDAERYFQAFSQIMDFAFRRLSRELGE